MTSRVGRRLRAPARGGRARSPVFGDDPVKEYWCSVEVSECGRFAVLYEWDFVHANVVYLLRMPTTRLPVASAMRSLNRVQVIGDSLLIAYRPGRSPRSSLRRFTGGTDGVETLIPQSEDTLQTVAGVAGRLYAVYSQAASDRVRIHAEDGSHLRDVELPALGSVNGNEGEGVISGVSGAWSGDEVWVRFESYVPVYRYDYAGDRLTPYHVPTPGSTHPSM